MSLRLDVWNGRCRRAGLSLMELVVVMAILIALAGLVVAILPSMLTRAHTSTHAANIAEILRNMQLYQSLHLGYPSDFDALVDDSGTLIDYLPGGNVGGEVSAGALTAAERQALFDAGVVRLWAQYPTLAAVLSNNGSPTFDPYNGNAISLAAGTPTVAFVSESAVESKLVSDPGGVNGDRYVIVGLGRRCTAIGKTMAEAPALFADAASEDPTQVYARYGLVFRVTRGGAAPVTLDKAVLVGVVAMHADGIDTAGSHIEEYYNLTRAQ